MTPEQLQTLKAAILNETDQAFVALRSAGETGAMAEWFNQPSTVVVWRSRVARNDVTVDGFDWTQVDNLTTGQARIWDLLFADGPIDPSEAGKRAGIRECWKGTAGKVAVGTFVLTQCKRFATRGEAVFATGAGTTASPSVSIAGGSISNDDIVQALNA